jgi:hypothetical protein
MHYPSNALWFWDETVQPVTAFNLALEAWWMAAVSAEMQRLIRQQPALCLQTPSEGR